MIGSQTIDNIALVTIEEFISKKVPKESKYAEGDSVCSVCAVVCQGAHVREIKSRKTGKTYYFLEFNIRDHSCSEVVGVQLWGNFARFNQLKHRILHGSVVLLQSVSLHDDIKRENRLTIQEQRYGYSSHTYVVDQRVDSKNCTRFVLDRADSSTPAMWLYRGRFDALHDRLTAMFEWRGKIPLLDAPPRSSARLVYSFREAATTAASTASQVDVFASLEVFVSGGAQGEWDMHERYLERGSCVVVEDSDGRAADLMVSPSLRRELIEQVSRALRMHKAGLGAGEHHHEDQAGVQASPGSRDEAQGEGPRSAVRSSVSLSVLALRARVMSSVDNVMSCFEVVDGISRLVVLGDQLGGDLDVVDCSFQQLLDAVNGVGSGASNSIDMNAGLISRLLRVSCLLRSVAFSEGTLRPSITGVGGHPPLPPLSAGTGDTGHPPLPPLSAGTGDTESVHMSGIAQNHEKRSLESGDGSTDGKLTMWEVSISSLIERRLGGSHGGGQSAPSFAYKDAFFTFGPSSHYSSHSSHDPESKAAHATRAGRAGAQPRAQGLSSASPPSPFVYSSSALSAGPALSGGAMQTSSSSLPPFPSPFPPSAPATTVEVVVKDAALTRLLCDIPACLCAVSLAQETEARNVEGGDGDSVFEREGLPSHNYAQSVRSLLSSLASSLAMSSPLDVGTGSEGMEAEIVVEVLPRYDDDDEVQTQRRPWVLAREILLRA